MSLIISVSFITTVAVLQCVIWSIHMCSCLRGFEPRNRDQWDSGNWPGWCERMTPLKADRANNSGSGAEVSVGEDGFFVQRGVKFPDFARLVNAVGSDCESNCLRNSSCTAYANAIGIGCMMWYGELVDIQRFENLGNVMNTRLADSDLGKVKIPSYLFALIDEFVNLDLQRKSVLFFMQFSCETALTGHPLFMLKLMSSMIYSS